MRPSKPRRLRGDIRHRAKVLGTDDQAVAQEQLDLLRFCGRHQTHPVCAQMLKRMRAGHLLSDAQAERIRRLAEENGWKAPTRAKANNTQPNTSGGKP